MRVIFMGTPEFAVPVLQGLIDHYKVRAVVTQPDRPVGRSGELQASPIKKLAEENTILVLQPESPIALPLIIRPAKRAEAALLTENFPFLPLFKDSSISSLLTLTFLILLNPPYYKKRVA